MIKNINEYTNDVSPHITKIKKLLKKVLKTDFIKKLGEGAYGSAFDIRDNKVLKITSDASEAFFANKLKGKKLENVYQIYEVYELTSQNKKSIFYHNKFYVIICEKIFSSKKLKNFFYKYIIPSASELKYTEKPAIKLFKSLQANTVKNSFLEAFKKNDITQYNSIKKYLLNINHYPAKRILYEIILLITSEMNRRELTQFIYDLHKKIDKKNKIEFLKSAWKPVIPFFYKLSAINKFDWAYQSINGLYQLIAEGIIFEDNHEENVGLNSKNELVYIDIGATMEKPQKDSLRQITENLNISKATLSEFVIGPDGKFLTVGKDFEYHGDVIFLRSYRNIKNKIRKEFVGDYSLREASANGDFELYKLMLKYGFVRGGWWRKNYNPALYIDISKNIPEKTKDTLMDLLIKVRPEFIYYTDYIANKRGEEIPLNKFMGKYL